MCKIVFMKARILKLSMFITLMNCISIIAQPSWVIKPPQGYLNDFYTGRGFSKVSKAEALESAVLSAIGTIVKNGNIKVSVNETLNSTSTEKLGTEGLSLTIVDKIAKDINVTGESTIIEGLKQVEFYTETNDNGYTSWVLVSIPKLNPLSPPSSFSPIWRSLLLPGWGQLYKEETFKGVSFMTLTLGGVAAGFIFNQLSIDAHNSAKSSRTQARRDFYNNDAKNNSTYSNISFISAGVVYAWGLIDAIIVKQENLFVHVDGSKNGVGVLLSINF